jgi:serine/threonine protein kinase
MKMVHRDIKPTNILIKGGVMKLADFGRSKYVVPNEKMTAVVGTKYYMPP